MPRLIKGASYNRDDYKAHAHQDPETAKAAIIDAGFDRMRLINAGNKLADKLRQTLPNDPALKEWEEVKRK